MLRLFIALALGGAAALIAAAVARWTSTSVRTTVRGASVPVLVDRSDFAKPERPWLLAVFTDRNCDACADVWARVRLLESGVVAACEVELSSRPEVHEKYEIDSVPMTLLLDQSGAVRRSFLGPVRSEDVSDALQRVVDEG